MEVRNRFKGLDLIHRVPDQVLTEVHDIVQETGIKTIPMVKKKKQCIIEVTILPKFIYLLKQFQWKYDRVLKWDFKNCYNN